MKTRITTFTVAQQLTARIAALCFLCVLLFRPALHAQSSTTSISFQGVLNGANDVTLPNGSFTLTFSFYSNAVGGVAVGTTNVTGVTVAGGVASTAIPVQPAWFDGSTRYLGITVAGQNGGQEFVPRVVVTAVPYAISAQTLRGGTVFINTNGHVGIGTPNPQALLHVGSGTTRGFIYVEGSTSTTGSPALQLNNLAPGGRAWNLYSGRDGDPGHFSIFDYQANSHRLVIDTDGHVGIGTLNPQAQLHVGSDAIRGTIYVEGSTSTTGSPVLQLHNLAPGGRVWSLYSGRDGDAGHFSIYDYQANSHRLVIDTDGHVGIGTLNPQAALDVQGTARMTVCQITSDRNAKTGFRPVDARAVLDKLAALPLTTWSYTNSPGIHIGPMAQDFAAAFALGEDDKHIATVDADGVALAAIQGLHQLVQEKDARIQNLEKRLEALERKLESRFAAQERH